MEKVRSAILTGASALLLALCAACNAEDGAGAAGGGTAVAQAYRGTYEVPVTPDLASAATYDVAEVEWTVANGTAKLDYALPLGLVGKSVRVEFTGPVGASAATAQLSGVAGTAACTFTGTAISCLENMAGLLPMEPDLAVIEQLAKTEYAGPAADRITVAKQFASDPIGIVHFDLTMPVIDDSHGGGSDD
ncbi:MAG: hypothetical protein QM820_62375 [Minicystis sp.]